MGGKPGRPFGAKDKTLRNIESSAKRCGRASINALAEVVEDKDGHQLARVLAAQTLLELGYGASLADRVAAAEIRCDDG